MTSRPLLVALWLTTVLSTGCNSFRDCTVEDASAAASLPATLSQTGLYTDIAAGELSEDALEFTPRFPLWTDGAKKRRWLVLPQGERVDTRDEGGWVFPVGTKFFKEFERDGIRVETRMNVKTADGWTGVAYLWNDTGDDADRLIEGGLDVSGTDHDVPSAAECLACHGGRADFTLGFDATQLGGEVGVALYEAGLLSDPVEVDIDLDPTALQALGTLHGNCSHCHNPSRHDQALATQCYSPDPNDTFDLSLPAVLGSLEDAPALQTARFLLGRPGDSEVLHRMGRRNQSEGNPSMPPLGTEIVDEEGVAAVEAFIEALPPRR